MRDRAPTGARRRQAAAPARGRRDRQGQDRERGGPNLGGGPSPVERHDRARAHRQGLADRLAREAVEARADALRLGSPSNEVAFTSAAARARTSSRATTSARPSPAPATPTSSRRATDRPTPSTAASAQTRRSSTRSTSSPWTPSTAASAS